jgi:hypothetical protein
MNPAPFFDDHQLIRRNTFELFLKVRWATVVFTKMGSMFEKGRLKGTPFPGNTP